jgi:tetratricopeptide (TPR) repeat protein
LTDGLTGGHVWSGRYDAQIEDVFELQDAITRQVVSSIQTVVHLNTIEEPVEHLSRPSLKVWELTMRSWPLLYDFSPESFGTAKTLLERALALDPESCEANMVLSLINHHMAFMGFAPDTKQAMEAAYALGRRATQLGDSNEYAHWAFGISCWGLHRLDEGIAGLERAVELNPNCLLAYGSLRTALRIAGRPDEAIRNQEVAIRTNPRDPSIFFRFSGLALTHYIACRHETAIDWAGRAIHRMPRWYFAHFVLAASMVALGKLEEAQRTTLACQAVLPDIRMSDVYRVPLKDIRKMEELRARNTALWKDVFQGDVFVVERMQRGRHAVGFDGGRFSPAMDGPTHLFQTWVAGKMIRPRSGTTASLAAE